MGFNPRKGFVMNVNGVTTNGASYSNYSSYESRPAATSEEKAPVTNANEPGAVYEPKLEIPTKTYKANEEMIARLKADAQERIDRLQNLVQQLISKQSGAYADANDIWNALREGKVAVDPATKAQAQQDISENGYWGVKATSDRIVDFAKALCGNDKSKLSEMVDAFKKGYEKAEKIWGGQLPEISRKTYDAVLEKFDNLMNSND